MQSARYTQSLFVTCKVWCVLEPTRLCVSNPNLHSNSRSHAYSLLVAHGNSARIGAFQAAQACIMRVNVHSCAEMRCTAGAEQVVHGSSGAAGWLLAGRRSTPAPAGVSDPGGSGLAAVLPPAHLLVLGPAQGGAVSRGGQPPGTHPCIALLSMVTAFRVVHLLLRGTAESAAQGHECCCTLGHLKLHECQGSVLRH